jgi:hypothetical protein
MTLNGLYRTNLMIVNTRSLRMNITATRKTCREADFASRPWDGMFAVPPEWRTSDAASV